MLISDWSVCHARPGKHVSIPHSKNRFSPASGISIARGIDSSLKESILLGFRNKYRPGYRFLPQRIDSSRLPEQVSPGESIPPSENRFSEASGISIARGIDSSPRESILPGFRNKYRPGYRFQQRYRFARPGMANRPIRSSDRSSDK
jgi:hypothetical protein